MNIVKKGQVLVWIGGGDDTPREYFVAIKDIDLDTQRRSDSSGRYLVRGLLGFNTTYNRYFESNGYYWINRLATPEEEKYFFQWLKEKGHYLNINTLQVIVNTQP